MMAQQRFLAALRQAQRDLSRYTATHPLLSPKDAQIAHREAQRLWQTLSLDRHLGWVLELRDSTCLAHRDCPTPEWALYFAYLSHWQREPLTPQRVHEVRVLVGWMQHVQLGADMASLPTAPRAVRGR